MGCEQTTKKSSFMCKECETRHTRKSKKWKTNRTSRSAKSGGAYHVTEEFGWGVESIMVSDWPVYCRIAISVTIWIQREGGISVAWVWNREGTEKLVNGTQHSVWFVPTGMNRLPQNLLLNFRLEFPLSDVTIYLPSGISEFSVKW